MTTQFKNRIEAGRALATRLTSFANRSDVLVLALPRGGVPVAAEVAKKLNAPLDVFVVRKLGVPGHPELAMGAIATGGVRVFNGDVINSLRIPDEVINSVTAEEYEELLRRERSYYGDDLPPPKVEGKTVIIVDDGIATGSTMIAAVAALRQLGAGRIVVAAPVIARSTFYLIHNAADEVAAVIAPDEFYGVGQWYEDFSQTTDDEVRQLLAETNHRAMAAAA